MSPAYLCYYVCTHEQPDRTEQKNNYGGHTEEPSLANGQQVAS